MVSSVSDGVRGNSGIVAKFTKGADPAIDFDGDIRAFAITPEDKDDDDITFLEAASGETKDYKVTTTAIQSTDADSFWRFLWDNPGDEFTVVYGPHGNAVPTAAKPHFLLTLKANGKPELGNEASLTKKRSTFEYEFEVTAGPTLDDGA